MHLAFRTILLFLLSNLIPLSTAFFPPLLLKQPTDCQYPDLSYGEFIYFTSPFNPDLTFAIYTDWSTYYPITLRAALVLDNFQLTTPPSPDSRKAICG